MNDNANPPVYNDPTGREINLSVHEITILGIGTGQLHFAIGVKPEDQGFWMGTNTYYFTFSGEAQ